MTSPFVHKFQSHAGNSYIYDVHTNNIFRADETVNALVDDFLNLSQPEIVSKWCPKFSERALDNALQKCNEQYKKGIFSEHHPKKMVTPYAETELKENLDAKINHLVLNVSERCNLRCQYCSYSGAYQYERVHSNDIMAQDTMEKAISYFVAHSSEAEAPAISFYGGEPLLAFEGIAGTLDFLRGLYPKQKYMLTIDSNGFGLNQQMVDFVIENNIHLQISLDGPSVQHDRYRVDANGKPTFARIMKNLEPMRKKSAKAYNNVTFACTICPGHDVVAINDFYQNNDFVANHAVVVSSVDPFDTTFYDKFTAGDFEHNREQIRILQQNYMSARINNQEPTVLERSLFERILIRIHRRDYNRLGDAIGLNGSCMPGVRKLFLNTKGGFQVCEKVGQSCSIGDVNTGVNFDMVKDVINQYVEVSSACLDCWGLRLCGACFSHARKGSRFDVERKKEQCRFKLEELHTALSFYATIMEKNHHAFDFAKNMIVK